MGYKTRIEWTDHTFNPWIGCTKISEACKHCYAADLAADLNLAQWGPLARRRLASQKKWMEPFKWNRIAADSGERESVFCASMADIFEDRPEVFNSRLIAFETMRRCKNLDWLLLTKRPENILKFLPPDWGQGWENVWLGVTAESQEDADRRLPFLAAVPAVLRFVSCEPLRTSLDLSQWLIDGSIGWVIAGGESGFKARTHDASWFRGLRDQCVSTATPFLFKQWGEFNELNVRKGKKQAGRLLDGVLWDEFPHIAHPKPIHPPFLPNSAAWDGQLPLLESFL